MNVMHTLWRGPMRVVCHNFAEYTLLDLVTHKEKLYHMTQLKPFHFDPTHVDPTDIARRDYLEFFIEDIRHERKHKSIQIAHISCKMAQLL